jgi:hypothetical protein
MKDALPTTFAPAASVAISNVQVTFFTPPEEQETVHVLADESASHEPVVPELHVPKVGVARTQYEFPGVPPTGSNQGY